MNWVSPEPGAKLASTSLDLVASGGSTSLDVDLTKVSFEAAWAGGKARLCSATLDASVGTWSCTADLLKLDVPPGKFTLTFDAIATSGAVATNAGGDLAVTYAVAPPKPTAVTYSDKAHDNGGTSQTFTDTIRWQVPAGYATSFRIYAVTFCPNFSPTAKDGTPCLSEHTALPASKLRLIKEVDGSARSVTLTESSTNEICADMVWCSDDVYALVISANNAYGQSVFTIVTSSKVYHSTY